MIRARHVRILVLGIVAFIAVGCGGASERVFVAAGTTIVDSGYIEALIGEYPGGGEFSIVAASSREAFSFGERGAADVLFTHVAEVEDEYLISHPDSWQAPVFESRFLVIGPLGQGIIVGGVDVADAFSAIAEAEAPFVSRSDGSGTAVREQAIWDRAAVDPSGASWYIETGQGMGLTLQVADQRNAFTLAEGGSFFADASVLGLEEIPVAAAPEELLVNPYRVTLVDPSAGGAGRSLFDWLISEDGRAAMIRVNEELYGRTVYAPSQ